MFNELCIRLPYLHPVLNGETRDLAGLYFARLKYFWPGHAALQTSSPWWQPENLPLSQAEAGEILSSLQKQNLHDMERIRLLMQQRLHEDDRSFRSEMADLGRFMEAPENLFQKSREELPLREAQIILLWLWRQEEEYLEIDTLARQCAQAESLLLADVHENAAQIPTLPRAGLQSSLDLLPDWKKIFQNAAFFIDPKIPVLLEGSMREDLLTEFSFVEMDCGDPDRHFSLKRASLPLWQILGLAREEKVSSAAARIWNEPRTLYALPTK